jgi:hypothetical protein
LTQAMLSTALALAVVILVGCAGNTDGADEASPEVGQSAAAAPSVVPTSPSAQPSATSVPPAEPAETESAETPAVAEPVAEATSASASTDTSSPTQAPAVAAAPTRSPAEGMKCDADLSTDDQKSRLVEILTAQFPGETIEGLPRVWIGPEARDHRQGGIWVVLEFNGEELETTLLKKEALDRQMRDAYEVIYNAGCDELVQVDLSALQKEFVQIEMMGSSAAKSVIIFKTSMKREVADSVDWELKESLDFNEIWRVLLFNVTWNKELRALKEGD